LDTSPEKTKKDINPHVAPFNWRSHGQKNDVFLFSISSTDDLLDSPKVDYRFQTNDTFSQPLSVSSRTCADKTRKDINLQIAPFDCGNHGEDEDIFLLTISSWVKELQPVKVGSQFCHTYPTPVSGRGRLA
jgi:hypothetical protein